jgi:hypothetical protein
MKIGNITRVVSVVFLMITGTLFGQPTNLPRIAIGIHWLPQLTVIDGKSTLYYELQVANLRTDSVKLKNLEVLDSDNLSIIAAFNSDDLKTRMGQPGAFTKGDETILLPGYRSVIYIEFSFQMSKPPQLLKHRLEFETLKGHRRESFSDSGGEFSLSDKPLLVLGPPLNAGPWAAVYEPSWERGHRRVIYTVDSKGRIPGRFAIDFIKLDEQGKSAKGTDNEIKNWYGYGADVLAVSDGVVASTRDDFPESQTLSEHQRYPAEKATGNYISIEIGKEQFIFYEHLKPGSIKVKPGQKVKKGDVIASLGFTGQTTGPHLHFHVADRNSPLGAEGIPFVFESFTVLGSYPDMEKFKKEVWAPVKTSNQLIRAERPGPNFVITF